MMVYVVKTAVYISLNEPLGPRKIFLHIFECRMTASIYTATVRIIAKGCLLYTSYSSIAPFNVGGFSLERSARLFSLVFMVMSIGCV